MTDKPEPVAKKVIPQEATEAPGSSELMESGVHKLPQEESETSTVRQQVEANIFSEVIPQEATEAPGSSELMESGVHKLPQEESETSTVRQQVEANVLSEELTSLLEPEVFEPRSNVAAFTKPETCTEESPASDDEITSRDVPHEATGFQTKRSKYVSGMSTRSERYQEAKHQVQEVFDKFPSALGLIILLACVEAPVEGLKKLVGVEKGADKMEDTFRKLGYAILRLPTNTTSLKLWEVMKAASETCYPESYKRIFFYFTGHGTHNAIYTPDAAVPQNEIVQRFQCVSDIPKVFIFDCCRDMTPTHPTCDAVNTMIIYSTMSGGRAYAPYDESGVMTTKLAELLLTKQESINDIVTELSQEVQDLHMHPVVNFQLKQSISLLKEREDAMRPNLQVHTHAHADTLTWEFPHLGEYFSLQSFTIVWKEESSENWKHLTTVDCLERQFDISTAQIPSTSRVVHVAVQADYQGKSVRSDEHTFLLTSQAHDGDGCLERLHVCGREGPQQQQSKCPWICLLVLLGIVVGVGVGVGVGIQLRPSSQKVTGFNNDTIECDQPSGIWYMSVQMSECGEYNGYRVDTYIVEGQLETYEWIEEEFDVAQPATVTAARINVPVNVVDRVPYLFEGSTINMSVCLQSTNATTSPVRLLVFDDLDKRKSYIEGKTDGEASVYQQQLPVGSHSRMQCSDVVYSVTHAGYYCIALDSPSGVIFKDNLTENVISVNISEYPAKCTVGKSDPCNLGIPFSSSVRVLCHIPKGNPGDPQRTSLCSSRQPRLAWTLPITCITFAAAITCVVCLLCFIVWCRKYHRRKGYGRIQSSIQN